MAYNVSRNLNFFTRIFTQFFGNFICLLFVGAKMMEHLKNKIKKKKEEYAQFLRWMSYSYSFVLVEV